MSEEMDCAVPGCNNTLTEDQRNKRISVCSECEAAKMHLCEICGKKLSARQIQNGATLCEECEMDPADIQEGESSEMRGYGGETEEEDFMV